MPLPKRYQSEIAEPALAERWQAAEIYHYDPDDPRPIYPIDTPPATVSGRLHIGHVFSYSHTDFMARYFRMRGYNVYYPMGFDDNGLPTERYVEKQLKIRAAEMERAAFVEACLHLSVEAEQEYRALWQRLGLSVDWRQTYRTIDEQSQRCSQHSFLDLYRKGLVYRAQAPMLWCPECHTAIAQADLEDRERTTEFVTLPFTREDEQVIRIATTRPELLAACVAVFIHPADTRYAGWADQKVRVPLYNQEVPVLTDPSADPQKGTGAVMCCTFGDQTDVAWWYSHHLPLIEAIDASGHMLPVTGEIAGLTVEDGHRRVKEILAERGLILNSQSTTGSIRVHERCDTPVEFQVTAQWFIRILENKQTFLDLGRQLNWHPAHMHARYQAWVENLNWDWCISRQRYFGVPFPIWYCKACGEVVTADENALPVDPMAQGPGHPCACGSTEFTPEMDVMDTWATSSVSPEIVSGWLENPEKFEKLFPMKLRPQAHEIIRTWTFDTIVKSWYHFGRLPWNDVLISGWAVAGEGMGKISKSKGGGGLPPMETIQRYSADAVRYWAASTSPGKDAIISEEKIQLGVRFVTKLWNVARFAEPFVTGDLPPADHERFTPTDAWILAGCRALVERVTAAMETYEYASAKAEIEGFFWQSLADNYLEMAKLRLYDANHPAHLGACLTLRKVVQTLIKLLAPFLPYVTDTIWQEMFAEAEGIPSIHRARWPESDVGLLGTEISLPVGIDPLAFGSLLVEIATTVRRYRSENALSLGSELARLALAANDPALASALDAAQADLVSVTRAQAVTIGPHLDGSLSPLAVAEGGVTVGIQVCE